MSGRKNIPPMDLPRCTPPGPTHGTIACVRSICTHIHIPLTYLRRNAALPHTIHIFNPKILKSTPDTHTILHQPLVSRFWLIFRILGIILNGISVSGPPFFGERPYPRQFHPVEMTPFFAIFRPQNSCAEPTITLKPNISPLAFNPPIILPNHQSSHSSTNLYT